MKARVYCRGKITHFFHILRDFSRTSEPILFLCVIIWMHFLCWIQVLQWKFELWKWTKQSKTNKKQDKNKKRLESSYLSFALDTPIMFIPNSKILKKWCIVGLERGKLDALWYTFSLFSIPQCIKSLIFYYLE